MTAVRDEQGFSLVELLVAMTVGMFILLATLASFDAFSRGVDDSSRLVDAQDGNRRELSTIVQILREAGAPDPVAGQQQSTVISASPLDVVFRSTSWPGESATGITGLHVQRLCVNQTTKVLWFEGLRAGTAGSSTPGSACPTSETGWTRTKLVEKVTNNTTDKPLFRSYSTPVRSIGLTLRQDGGRPSKAREIPLASGSSPRGALAPQLTAGDVTVTCNADGAGKHLLSLAAGLPKGLRLSAAGAISSGPANILLTGSAAAAGSVTLTVTDLLGLKTVLFKTVTC